MSHSTESFPDELLFVWESFLPWWPQFWVDHCFAHLRSKLLLLLLQGCADGEEVDDGAYGGEYDYVDEGILSHFPDNISPVCIFKWIVYII